MCGYKRSDSAGTADSLTAACLRVHRDASKPSRVICSLPAARPQQSSLMATSPAMCLPVTIFQYGGQPHRVAATMPRRRQRPQSAWPRSLSTPYRRRFHCPIPISSGRMASTWRSMIQVRRGGKIVPCCITTCTSTTLLQLCLFILHLKSPSP